MEIHTPKPVRSWRELFTEIGIIVLSVCIALAAEQAVEWVHWRDQAHGARMALAQELSLNIANGAGRVVRAACLEQRLDHIADLLDGASRSGALPSIAESDVGGAAQNDWPTSTWNNVTSSEVVSHISRNEINGLGVVYQQIQMLSRLEEQELVIWADLSAMIGPGRRLDPAMDTSLHLALSRARLLDRIIAQNSGQVVQRALALALPYADEDRQRIAQSISLRRGCRQRPGANATVAPPRYGQAPRSGVLEILRAYQKLPPYTDAK